MNVRILFFGMLKDLAGRGSDSLSLPEGSTLADVLSHYEQRIPKLKNFTASIAMSVNQEYAAPEVRLKSGDEIALLPPVSGGSEETADKVTPEQSTEPALSLSRAGRRYTSLVRDKIDAEAILQELKRPEDGSAILFEGVVRNHTRGRRTLYLEYVAYEEMASKQMEALAAQALNQFKIRDVAIVHRLGRLEIGEASVLIVVASAHRAAAFEACRWLIDSLKRTVPIWKKEYFEDGAVWADGEPFPAEVPRPSGSPVGGSASK